MNTSQQIVHQLEQQRLHDWLPQCFGFHLLYMSLMAQAYVVPSRPIAHQIFVSEQGKLAENFVNVRADFIELPFASNSLDVVILPHVLEFVADPRALLDEICRVVIPGGYLCLLAYNPQCLWGIKSLVSRTQFLNHQPLKRRAVYHLLSAHAFTREKEDMFFYRPSSFSALALERLQFMERLGRVFWPGMGASYGILARKKISSMMPIKTPWRSPSVRRKTRFVESTN